MTSAVRRMPPVPPVVAVLGDGTPCYAPPGTMVRDGHQVQCHLCGGWFRSVGPHLRVHGWARADYREALGLERGESLEGHATRERRSSALRRRLATDPAVRAGSAAGRALTRTGALTRAAASAAVGRVQPEQRRRKTLRSLAAISPAARAAGTRRAARERLCRVAAAAAHERGFPDLGSLVRARAAAGMSLAAISRECGLHKDWLCRHLATVDPAAARDVAGPALARLDLPWCPVLRRFGYDDVRSYLVARHVDGRLTVAAIAAETGLSRGAVQTALRRHGVPVTAHAAVRGRQRDSAAEIAARWGFADLDAYLTDRRAAGLSWRAIAAECGRPATWVRRQAGFGVRAASRSSVAGAVPAAVGAADAGPVAASARRTRGRGEQVLHEVQGGGGGRVPPREQDAVEPGAARPLRVQGRDDGLQHRALPA